MRVQLSSGTAAEVALPPGGEVLRGVVIATDAMGLRPLFDDMVARLAADHGWAVSAVEPFPGQESLQLEQRQAARIDARRLTSDLLLAADDLRERGARADRVAVVGFCMGGMNAYRAAGTGRFDRGVSFYGMIRPPEPWSVPGDDPLDALARPGCCPVLAICGGADQFTPPADIEALRAAGAHVTVRLYQQAEHGFVHDPARPAHRPDDAADAWRWAVEFLA
ncbi:MAG: dienelactone hydrolase family protein [Actinobacteria bacterium]|nr:dienelactone hydrolase family protein [Actinomycetota bacterium]